MPASVSGMLVKKTGSDPQIMLNSEDHPNRARFTCAHELGHYILRGGEDVKYTRVDYRDSLSATGKNPEEVFANKFAAALLMPADELRTRFSQDPSIAGLAYEFKVSAEAMRFRLTNLAVAE